MVLDHVSVVARIQEADRRSGGERHRRCEGEVRPHLGLHLDVAGTPAERTTRELKVGGEVQPLVRMNAVVTEVEARVDLGVRNHERRQVPVERALVSEGIFDLQVVADARVELPVRSIEPDSPFQLPVAEHGFRRFVASHEQRKDVELRPQVEVRSRLEKPGLLQLEPQPLFRQDARGGHDVVDPGGKEDETRSQLDAERAQPAEKIVVFPGGEAVNVGLELVELDAAAQSNLSQPVRLDPHGQRHHVRLGRRIAELGSNLDGAEHFEIEQRPRRILDRRRRVGFSFLDVDRPPHRLFRDLDRDVLRIRGPSLDGDLPERGWSIGRDGKDGGRGVTNDVDQGVAFDLGICVAAVGQRAPDVVLGLLELVLVERLARRKRSVRRARGRGGDVLGQSFQAFEPAWLVIDRGTLFDVDVDADVVRTLEGDESRRGVRVVVSARAVVALDPREIALQRRAAEERVLVEHAAKQTEELGTRRRSQLVGDVGRVELTSPVEVDAVNGSAPVRNGRAPADEPSQCQRPQQSPGRTEMARIHHGLPRF